MNPPAIVLDCDPGHDDAITILMAAHLTDLVGVTTVSGNAPLALTTHNALITTQILGLATPVHAGAARPLLAPARHAPFIHGETGLGGPTLPALARQVASHDAVRFIIETARARGDLTLVATGPLTNVALALRAAPDIATRLRGVALMGGSTSFGNVTPVAEFNIWADPEAAAIVFASGVRIVMCGLNLTHQVMVTPPFIKRVRAMNNVDNPAVVFVADMLEFYTNAYANTFSGIPAGPLHDPCALLTVTHPALFTLEPRHVVVECHGEFTRGMTVVDERKVIGGETSNIEVAYEVDSEAVLALLLEALPHVTLQDA